MIINFERTNMKRNFLYIVCAFLAALATSCSNDRGDVLAANGDCMVEAFALDNVNGVIDAAGRSIAITVPTDYDASAMKVTALQLSEGATCNIQLGAVLNMDAAKVLHVVNGGVFMDWTVIVRHEKIAIKPAALFLGLAYSASELDPEAKTACEWMLENVDNSYYASFDDIKEGLVDLSECKLMWWHWHDDHVVDGHDGFLAKGTAAMAVKNQLKAFRDNGGAFLLTRYATHLPTFIGVTGTDEWTVPNNCFGDPEPNSWNCGGVWAFNIYAGQANHPVWKNLVNDGFDGKVPCTNDGYFVSNSTAQYHIGWDGWETFDAWGERTGGHILGATDDAVVAWEYPATASKGGIVCIGYGGYDWYSPTFGAGYTEHYHQNIEIMTKNAIDYLMD